MKKLAAKFMAVMAFAITTATSVLGQNGFAYQAVIRNANGELITNQLVDLKFTLKHNDKDYYTEKHSVSTNEYGNIQVMVGEGTKLDGSFDDVPWNTLDIKMAVAVDVEGSGEFLTIGEVPIQSAPYAMFAQKAGGYSAQSSASKDGDALFAVNDANGNPVFAVFANGIVVYVDDTDSNSNQSKAVRSGFVVTGRSATKDKPATEYFSVTTEGTQIYVDDAGDQDDKAMRSGFVVTGRSATKDGQTADYLTIGGEGTTVYVDDNDKAVRSGFVVTGRSATKDGQTADYLTIGGENTTIYVDDNDKAVRSGFVVTGRSATKDDADNYLAVDGNGTQVYVDGPDSYRDANKAMRSGFVVTGRSATKDDEKIFAIEGGYTRVYIGDDEADKAKRSGFVVTGRSATKDTTETNYLDINKDSTNLFTAELNVTEKYTTAPVEPDSSGTPVPPVQPKSVFTISGGNVQIGTGGLTLTGDVEKKIDAETIAADSTGTEIPKLAKIIDRADTVSCSIFQPFIYGDNNANNGYALLGIYSKGSYSIVSNTDASGNMVLLIDESGFVTKKAKNATVAVLMPEGDTQMYIRPLKATNQTISFGLMKKNAVEPYQYIQIDVDVEAHDGIAYNVVVNSSNGGKVKQSGSAVYGGKMTIEAVPDDNYVFAGWSDNKLLLKRTLTITDNVELYAQFDLKTYAVAVAPDNEEHGSVSGSGTYEHGSTATLVATPQTGYHFAGWEGIKLSDEQATSKTITIDVTKELNITAKFDINKHKLTYQIEGDEKPIWTDDVAYNQPFPSVEVENRNGYEFNGWQNKLDAMPDTDYTITGSFSAIPYSIAYNANGGTMPNEYTTSYTIEDNVVLPTPDKQYYEFEYWYADDYEGNKVENIAVGTTGDFELTAKWTPISYKIVYELNGGKFETSYLQEYNVETQAFTLPYPKNTGHTFVGWIFNNNIQDTIKDFTVRPGNKHTGKLDFKAVWELNYYDITFKNEGFEDSVVSVGYNNKIEKPDDPERDGYEFLGWYNGDTEFDFENTPVTDAITLTANWMQVATLVFKNDVNDEEPIATMTAQVGGKLNASDIPSATYSMETYTAEFNYEWCYNTDENGLVPFNFDEIPAGTYTLLPKWSATFVVKQGVRRISKVIEFINVLDTVIDYTIMVDGLLEGSDTIIGIISGRPGDQGIVYDTTPIPARSITLCGKTGYKTDIIDAGWKIKTYTYVSDDETITEENWVNEYNEELDGRWDKSRPLTICTTVPVTIKDLTITRGLAINGGGLYIAEHANVTIADNTLITGNVADAALSSGGGVYMAESSTLYMTGGLITENQAYGGGGVFVSSEQTNGTPAVFYMSGGQIADNQAEYGGGVGVGGKLYMYGSAVIGDPEATESATDSDHSNSATYYGGGIYNCASAGYDRGVYIGYTNDLTTDPNFTGGVFHNYASGYYEEWYGQTYGGEGGGIYSGNGGYVYLNGKVNYNYANSDGGGLYISGSWGKLVMESGEINHNTTQNVGGGVYLSNCEVDDSESEIRGGTISYNQSRQGAGLYLSDSISIIGGEISGNTLVGTDSYGSGIYADNNFMMGGSAIVAEGNDIYLPYEQTITVGELDGEGTVATITLGSHVNGTQVLCEENSENEYVKTYYNRFAVTPDTVDGKVVQWLIDENGYLYRSVTVTYYINNQEHTVVLEGDERFESKVADPSGNDVPEGCEFSQWNAILDGEYVPVKDIYCDTTLYATWSKSFVVTSLDEWNTACSKLTNEMCRDTIKVDGIVEGLFVVPATAKSLQVIITGNGEDDELKANTQGSVLTVNSTEAPIFINNLIIVGGKSANGGGIYINNDATVALGNGVYVRGNTAIYDDEDDNTGRGGGVYNAGTLFMYGSARIGSDSSWVASSDYKSNLAERGGGLYNAATGIVYLGFSSETQTTYLDGGIRCNYASSNGGGVFNDGIIRMNSGNIANNGTNGSGGGVYNAGTTYMWGDAVIGDQYTQEPAGSSSYSHSNYAQSGGGGICNKGRLYLGYSNADTEAELYGGVYYNYSDHTNGGSGGGGIYNFLSSGSDFAMASGNIAYNTAHDNHSGGGISLGGMDNISVNITGGTITRNQAGSGGGIDCGSRISLYVSDVEISYNSANYKSSGTNASSGGGGINVDGGSLTLDDSTKIIGNASANHGGGINVWGTNSVIIKGNTIISGNTVSTTTADKYCGGAIYTANTTLTFEGNAYVPYGGGKRQNDIVIDGGWNTHSLVAGDLSNNTHSSIATLYISEYKQDSVMLQFPEGMETNDAAMRFNVADPAWGILSDGTLCAKDSVETLGALMDAIRDGKKYIVLAGTKWDSVKIDMGNENHIVLEIAEEAVKPRIEFAYVQFNNGNSSEDGDHHRSGGAIYADGVASLVFRHCTFEDNSVPVLNSYDNSPSDTVCGSAIFATNVQLITIDSCSFKNSTRPYDGALRGGFLYFYKGCGYASIDSTTFENGNARHGGAIGINSEEMVTSIRNSVFTNCNSTYQGTIDYSVGRILIIENNYLDNAIYNGAPFPGDDETREPGVLLIVDESGNVQNYTGMWY